MSSSGSGDQALGPRNDWSEYLNRCGHSDQGLFGMTLRQAFKVPTGSMQKQYLGDLCSSKSSFCTGPVVPFLPQRKESGDISVSVPGHQTSQTDDRPDNKR